ncbi:RNA polymerase sigma factor [Desertimonas flava]|uniref:RNA polymerase sigma factor n=1 Tax=Desertimonas flava TaxID=2064846 RepID=UPI000E34C8CF|nr:RNA polymerase sigma factor [Desertimonas flava]
MGDVSTEDRELARRFPSGDESALRDVYERYGRAVYTVTFSILRDPDRAADATQAAFVNAWRASARFDPAHALAPWLYTIARRTAIDAYRRERRMEPTDPSTLDAVADLDAEPGLLVSTWEAWQVRMAVDALPPDEREVVRLSWFEGLSHPEIAERLAVPVGTVKSRSHRAHRRLAAALSHVRDENRPDGPGVEDDGWTTQADGVAPQVHPARGEPHDS